MATLKTANKENVTGTDIRNVTPLSGEIYEAIKDANTLSRYDDFESLKIPLGAYKHTEESGEYGIVYDEHKHIGTIGDKGVIFDHQMNAARRFLSELRGFGLLADCVGSGKTYEACMVLSELACRGMADSVLIIVPDEQLVNNWKYVFETCFGFGKGQLVKIDERASFSSNEPHGAYIITQDDFSLLSNNVKRNVLFKVIVVDEAHNLCLEREGKATALAALSMMMATKKKAGFPYCLLLSATPHSGNLENMFKLWYFIRCRGGEPRDFTEGAKTAAYESEKEYYLKTVCNGAKTVAEYIERTKIKKIMGSEAISSGIREKYLRGFEASINGRKTTFKPLTVKEHNALAFGEQKYRCDAFLNDMENGAIHDEVIRQVAHDYHNIVMRSIMIRQPNNVSKGRNAVNYLFMPVKIKPAISPRRTANVANYFIDDRAFDKNYEFLNAFVGLIGDEKKNAFFPKKGSAQFYNLTLSAKDEDPRAARRNRARRELKVRTVTTTESNVERDIFYEKCKTFVEIIEEIDENAQKEAGASGKARAVVFFDYDKENNVNGEKPSWEKLKEYLSGKGRNDILERIIDGNLDNIRESIGKYNENDGAILLAEDFQYTEGQNLQKGCVVINFEVSPDPLTLDQRIGRVFRLGQEHDVTVYSLAAANELDGYCLSYFVKVDLISDANGDATIIAGTNNQNMRALQCPKCKALRLMSERDYLEAGKLVRCNGNSCEGEKMIDLTMAEAECENPNCSVRIARTRTDDDNYEYLCWATDKRKLTYDHDVRNGKKINKVRCGKICAMRHCAKLINIECPLVTKYKNVNDVNELSAYCEECPRRDECKRSKCVFDQDVNGSKYSFENSCAGCPSATCIPKPCVIEFNENWEARCPACGSMIRLKSNLTFASYLKMIYDFPDNSGGMSFCDNFGGEVRATKEVKDILTNDGEES